MAIGSYASSDISKEYAEVAFVVRDDLQNMGIGSFLLKLLEKIAKENGYKGFIATVLIDNTKMIHVFKKRYHNAKLKRGYGGEVEIYMDFPEE